MYIWWCWYGCTSKSQRGVVGVIAACLSWWSFGGSGSAASGCRRWADCDSKRYKVYGPSTCTTSLFFQSVSAYLWVVIVFIGCPTSLRTCTYELRLSWHNKGEGKDVVITTFLFSSWVFPIHCNDLIWVGRLYLRPRCLMTCDKREPFLSILSLNNYQYFLQIRVHERYWCNVGDIKFIKKILTCLAVLLLPLEIYLYHHLSISVWQVVELICNLC